MQGQSKQHIAAVIVNRMTSELMELTQLLRENCQDILVKQLSKTVNASTQRVLEVDERDYIWSLFH